VQGTGGGPPPKIPFSMFEEEVLKLLKCFNYYYNYITNKYLIIVKFIGFSLPILMKLGLLG